MFSVNSLYYLAIALEESGVRSQHNCRYNYQSVGTLRVKTFITLPGSVSSTPKNPCNSSIVSEAW
ncbi:hypothetical protein COO91_06230 [Nostoc flagelliforme CCNUN1]|uniref:Uncharacterized protein n=1 Tax=Nostoc flagelliforme CCNUN1 TaxID=2038116 RepID=A0A2K8SXQ7_9NOSO|nr:hypothetical protein [Nostoc flagelliforme]AUB40224.1 hypothetical protein COO91_06230 [Nostoc flagelliforme CCNUN1]